MTETSQFLLYTAPNGANHLRNIFKTGELADESVCALLAHTARDGKTYRTNFYNLDAIIAVEHRAAA